MATPCLALPINGVDPPPPRPTIRWCPLQVHNLSFVAQSGILGKFNPPVTTLLVCVPRRRPLDGCRGLAGVESVETSIRLTHQRLKVGGRTPTSVRPIRTRTQSLKMEIVSQPLETWTTPAADGGIGVRNRNPKD